MSDPEKTADIFGISSVMAQDMSGERYGKFYPLYALVFTEASF
jgi:hypothetical protein